MESLSWMAALALLTAAPAPKAERSPARDASQPSPARDALPPTQRAEDRPAHESPYSAFGAPHAKRNVKKRAAARLHCADGTLQPKGEKGAQNACEGHGGLKKK